MPSVGIVVKSNVLDLVLEVLKLHPECAVIGFLVIKFFSNFISHSYGTGSQIGVVTYEHLRSPWVSHLDEFSAVL